MTNLSRYWNWNSAWKLFLGIRNAKERVEFGIRTNACGLPFPFGSVAASEERVGTSRPDERLRGMPGAGFPEKV